MNIGIFVTFLKPRAPSQARLQEAILSGLRTRAGDRYRFMVFSFDGPRRPESDGVFTYHRVAMRSRWAEPGRRLAALAAQVLKALWTLPGVSGGRMADRLARWAKVEPAHYRQMRELDIRVLWNMHQHELKVPVPFIRTIWEANHRIHSMFPEYSYTRFGFDALDGDMAGSLARASYVITGTEEGRRQVIDMLGVHADKVRVAPFPAPRLPEPGPQQRTGYILYPARFWPHKNHVVILEALRILKRQRRPTPRCVFIGSDEGNLDYVLRYAERLGVRDLVDYRGRVSEAELAALYHGAEALVFASAVGPDNLPPLEAMSLGCPVITADVPGAREQCGDAALFFPSADEAALAERVVELAGDEALRAELIARGKARAQALTPEAYAGQVMAILDEFAAVARAWERCDSAFN